MARWRRSADSEVHVQIEGANLTRCGIEADELAPLDRADQAICDDCAFAVLHDASDAEDCLRQLKTDRVRVPEHSSERTYKACLEALRALVRTVPSTEPSFGLLTEAERVLYVGDVSDVLDLVRQWRTRMGDSGVLP